MNPADNMELAIERLYVSTSAELDRRILADASAALEESVRERPTLGAPSLWRVVLRSRIAKLAAVVALVITTLAVAVLIWTSAVRDKKAIVREPDLRQRLAAEFEWIEQTYAVGDIDGLVAMLSEGQFASKVLAAKYLGQIGDERALPELDRLYLLAEERLPPGYTENPFAEPIEKIRNRIKTELDQRAVESDVNDIGAMEVPAATGRVLDFFVVDRLTAEPIAGVELHITVDGEESNDVTDEQGQCRIQFGKKQPNFVRIDVHKEGFVPMRVQFRKDEPALGIPKDYRLALQPGTSIGGFIQNEQGEPIEGATVYLLMPGSDESQTQYIWIWDHKVQTDVIGFWRCDIVPAKLDDIWIRLGHPEYIDDEVYGTTAKPSVEALRDMSGVMVMKRGLTVVGQVVDSNGVPIQAAVVAQGSDRFGTHYPSTTTDTEGRFEFSNARPGEMILTVQAQGYAPDLREFTALDGLLPIEFRLAPGHRIRGQIVDAENAPVDGAFVAADTWRGHRSLRWRVNTDSQGRFEWKDAPPDEVQFDMGKKGYMSVRHLPLSASDDEYVVVMYRALQLSGMVVDAISNEPIREFKVICGTNWNEDSQTSWDRRSAKTFTAGQYEVHFDEPRYGYLIRVEAAGYVPAVSRVVSEEEEDVVIDFGLEKSEGPSGVVCLPNGELVGGVEVVLCPASRIVEMRNGRIQQKTKRQVVESETDGWFAFPQQAEPYVLMVLDDQGFAKITGEQLETAGQITLEPWGRVEGVVRIGSRPGARERMSLYCDMPYEPNAPRFSCRYHGVTDAEGMFVFERVIPGRVRVGREIQLSGGGTAYSHAEPVDVMPGETVTVTIGGTGRPVVGQLVVPADYPEPVDWAYASGSVALKMPELPLPENYDTMTQEEIKAWREAWKESEEGKAFIKTWQQRLKQRRHYAVVIEPDGSFRVDDVPAEMYQLRVSVYERPKDRLSGREELIGSINYYFEVPEMPERRSDEPLDIGILEVGVTKR